MPLPKQLKDTEGLAGVLAYLESSEKGPSATLEEDAREAYGMSTGTPFEGYVQELGSQLFDDFSITQLHSAIA